VSLKAAAVVVDDVHGCFVSSLWSLNEQLENKDCGCPTQSHILTVLHNEKKLRSQVAHEDKNAG